MRRKLLPVLIVFIVLAAIVLIPFDKEDVIRINAPYFNCYQQLTSPQNWEKWQSDINGIYQTDSALCKLSTSDNVFKIVIPDGSFIVQKQSSTNLAVKKSEHNKTLSYDCSIIPDTSDLVTSVVISYSTSVIKYAFSKLSGTDLHQADMYDFKKYMEDTKAYYGYYIKTDFLKAKKIVVSRKTVLTKNVWTEAAAMESQLYHYIAKKKLKQTTPLMLQYISQSHDSTQLMIGIPVDKTIKTDHEFLYMEIPASNTLMADFSGRYGDKQKAYTAVEKYLQDKHLHRKIAPLEVFDSALPKNADETIMFRIVYPVF